MLIDQLDEEPEWNVYWAVDSDAWEVDWVRYLFSGVKCQDKSFYNDLLPMRKDRGDIEPHIIVYHHRESAVVESCLGEVPTILVHLSDEDSFHYPSYYERAALIVRQYLPFNEGHSPDNVIEVRLRDLVCVIGTTSFFCDLNSCQ
jgi:hypothetical protein